MIVSAILFLVVLFLFKKTSLFDNKETYKSENQDSGLAYDTTIGELTVKDVDGDGIPDWEEPLYGLDPTKKETIPGVPDITTINKLKSGENLNNDETTVPKNLTETEKFSQQLFSTVASLNQNGMANDGVVDEITTSLSNQIKNTTAEKVFTSSGIKILNDDSLGAIKTYKNAMLAIQAKYPDKGNVFDILQRFIVDANTSKVDESVLVELDPIIAQTQNTINAILKVGVPASIAPLHLAFLNAGERLLENISSMKFFDSDPILAVGAMSKYDENISSFQDSLHLLIITVMEKLNS